MWEKTRILLTSWFLSSVSSFHDVEETENKDTIMSENIRSEVIKGKEEKVDELKEIEISKQFLEEYKKLVLKYKRDFDTILRIIKVDKL